MISGNPAHLIGCCARARAATRRPRCRARLSILAARCWLAWVSPCEGCLGSIPRRDHAACRFGRAWPLYGLRSSPAVTVVSITNPAWRAWSVRPAVHPATLFAIYCWGLAGPPAPGPRSAPGRLSCI